MERTNWTILAIFGMIFFVFLIWYLGRQKSSSASNVNIKDAGNTNVHNENKSLDLGGFLQGAAFNIGQDA